MPAEVIGKYFEINGINKPRTESYTEYCVLEAKRLDILLKKTVSARSTRLFWIIIVIFG